MKRKKHTGGQAVYQRAYREQQKSLRKPGRDDLARVALFWIITKALQRDKEDELARWEKLMTERLVEQGFDRDATRIRINGIIERYRDGWDFQLKPQLRRDEAEL